MESMESHKDGFPPFPHPLEIPSGLPHSHSFDDGENMYLDRQTPPKTLDQSHFQRRGVVNHVSGLKRKGCPGTLNGYVCSNHKPAKRARDGSPRREPGETVEFPRRSPRRGRKMRIRTQPIIA